MYYYLIMGAIGIVAIGLVLGIIVAIILAIVKLFHKK